MRPLFIAITLASLTATGFALPGLFTHDDAAFDTADQVAGLPSAGLTRGTHGGSGIEEATGEHYQHDGGIPGDAPDSCLEVDRDRMLGTTGNATQGIVVQEDDESDVFYAPFGSDLVGQRMVFELARGLDFSPYKLGFDILDGACGFSVFDPDADIYHPERDIPAEPFTAKPAHETYDYDFTSGYICDADEWKFLIKHKRGAQPSALYVEWTNGDFTYVANNGDDPSEVSKYITSHNLHNTVARIAVQMPTGFSGSLQVSHGPCGLVAADGPPSPAAPSTSASGGEFTVVVPGDYVLRVWIARDIVEHAQDQVGGLPGSPFANKVAPGQGCHARDCQAFMAAFGFEATLIPHPDGVA